MTTNPPPSAEVWASPERTAILRRDADIQAEASREETELLVRSVGIPAGASVLDLACGAGDPTLALARRSGPEGRVVGVDLSEGALGVGRERAEREGLRNVRFEVADATALPFPDRQFDRVVCRFGSMFFADLQRAADETRRVLRAHGRAGFMVWGRFDQPYMLGTVGVILRHLERSAPPPEMMTPFRLADPAELVNAFEKAGLRQVRAEAHTVHWVWSGDPASARDNWRNGLVFWRRLVDELPPGTESKVWEEVKETFGRYYDGKQIRMPLLVNVVTAERET